MRKKESFNISKYRININYIALLSCSIILLLSMQVFSQKHEKSLLWEITGNKLSQPSYLFGTVHIIDSADYFLDESVVDKLLHSEKLVFEVNTSMPDFAQKALQKALMKNDSLDNIYTKDEYEELNNFFKNEFGFPLAAVKKMKPFYLSSVVVALSMPKSAKSYEEELKKIADENGIEISGISTLDKESEILGRMDMDIQKYSLDEAINEYRSGFKQKEEIVKLYQQNDINGIDDVLTSNTDDASKKIYDIMFHQRHIVWIPLMEKLMSKENCFFAVGVGHLPGELGLLEQFRRLGYKVKPIYFVNAK